MTQPTVSVVLPVYNGENYLRSAIDGVLNQTFQGFELIVVDDGSKDSTGAIAQAYGTRVTYVRQPNGGAAAAVNHGLRLARGAYISWLSHDDIYAPAKLATQLKVVRDVGGPAACYTDAQIMDPSGRIIREVDVPDYGPRRALRHLVTPSSLTYAAYSLLFDRRCIDVVGYYDEARRHTQDADMLVRLARHFPLVHAPGKLVQVREHPQSDHHVHYDRWVRETFDFTRGWLRELALEELFPELVGRNTPLRRAVARRWLGDAFVGSPPPFCWIAVEQYRAATAHDPRIAPSLAPRLVGLVQRLAGRALGSKRLRGWLPRR